VQTPVGLEQFLLFSQERRAFTLQLSICHHRSLRRRSARRAVDAAAQTDTVQWRMDPQLSAVDSHGRARLRSRTWASIVLVKRWSTTTPSVRVSDSAQRAGAAAHGTCAALDCENAIRQDSRQLRL
jgi:hypothetical protein